MFVYHKGQKKKRPTQYSIPVTMYLTILNVVSPSITDGITPTGSPVGVFTSSFTLAASLKHYFEMNITEGQQDKKK